MYFTLTDKCAVHIYCNIDVLCVSCGCTLAIQICVIEKSFLILEPVTLEHFCLIGLFIAGSYQVELYVNHDTLYSTLTQIICGRLTQGTPSLDRHGQMPLSSALRWEANINQMGNVTDNQ